MEFVEIVVKLIADEFIVLHVKIEFVTIDRELGTTFLDASLKACFVMRGLVL